jgi:TonB family protein
MNAISAYNSRKALTSAVLVSLALHGGLLFPLLLWTPSRDAHAATEKLRVELYGMLADRQTERRVAGVDSPPPVIPAQQRPTATDHRLAAKVVETNGPAEVRLAARSEDPVGPLSAPTPAREVVAPLPSPGTAKSSQEQQTISDAAQDLNELRQYLGKVRKRLQGGLKYPSEAEKEGHEGTPVVGFRIAADGSIAPGTLSIVESCGYAELDASALDAARASTPFERPPRAMDVKVGVNFEGH